MPQASATPELGDVKITVMNSQIIATIVLSSIGFITTTYLEAESNFQKPKLDRNNVLNKGLWIRRDGPRSPRDFIFRANSLDVDKILQNNYDSFGTNVQSSPIFNSYIDRNKRSTNNKRNPLGIGTKICKTNNCTKNKSNKLTMIKSKLISTLKPASVFNDYPYEVAILLDDKDHQESGLMEDNASIRDNRIGENTTVEITHNKVKQNLVHNDINDSKKLSSAAAYNATNKNVAIPKRSMDRHNYETELIKKIEFTEQLNDTSQKSVKNIFDREDMEWRDPGPVPNVNVYKVLPKSQGLQNKPISERGLLKVLSVLTKTFKKIMKQHHDIKIIHNTINNLNNDFIKNMDSLTSKYNDINKKYSQIMKINDALQLSEAKIKEKELNFDIREKKMSHNLLEFQKQQKKFLDQQRQFYNVQKLMLAQNEKINIKQNLIAKTQSEISHRQNNFARILKKAKQIYIDSKSLTPPKLNTAIAKPKLKPVTETDKPKPVFTTSPPLPTDSPPLPTTEPVKIDLFSIPPIHKLKNHDQKILDEKDEQPVDELIYKYYFNNTFIDELMKNKILATFIAATEDGDVNNNKNKRNEGITLQTTILLPINNTNESKNKSRKKRWIKHVNKIKKKPSIPEPPIRTNITPNEEKFTTNIDIKNSKNGPFVSMAYNFCKEIGQNENLQMLKWCIEKSLRRLQAIDLKAPLSTPISVIKKNENTQKIYANVKAISTTSTSPSTNTQTDIHQISSKTTAANSVMFFPDNDELENKIKEYELRPDPEGTIYFDGSLHASDLGMMHKNSDLDSEGFSDIMPGLDSNSRVQVDPLAFDLQAQRRANVRRINERIMKMKAG